MKYSVINNKELSGGHCDFLDIRENNSIGFKQFSNKTRAQKSYHLQKKLNEFGLAPKTYGKVCKLLFYIDEGYYTDTEWGFITEKADILGEKKSTKKLKEIQNLVNKIYNKTGLKFWDCHYWNIGYIKRNNKKRLVCIDTGIESFNIDCNAWGFIDPGPKCSYCSKYQCKCSEY